MITVFENEEVEVKNGNVTTKTDGTMSKNGKVASDGSTASYYELPDGCSELQDLISHKNMNAQMGEIFRACYRYGEVEHSEELRDIKKIIFYATAELKRIENLNRKRVVIMGRDVNLDDTSIVISSDT